MLQVSHKVVLATLVQTKDGPALSTLTLQMENFKDRSITSPEMSSLLGHCCTMLIGVAIGTSEKIRSSSKQNMRKFKTLMVTLGKAGHGESANHLSMYNPGPGVDRINSQPWAGNLLLGMLQTQFVSPGKEMMEQVRMVASYAQMTTYTTTKLYLDQCMDGTLALPHVAVEIPLFLTMEKELKKAMGQWFEFLGAIRHPDAMKLAPKAFPSLASAALFWSWRENSTMTAYKAPVIQPGSTLTEVLLRKA